VRDGPTADDSQLRQEMEAMQKHIARLEAKMDLHRNEIRLLSEENERLRTAGKQTAK